MAWYDTNWKYRKKFTTNGAQINGTQATYSWAIIRTDSDLKDVSNGGKVGKSDGTDFLITDSDEVTKLNHEIVSYDPVTGKLWLYFQAPSISSTGGEDFYLYYGNAAAADQQNVDGTWRTQFKGVWHLQESGNGTTDEFKDSSGFNNHGTGGNGTSSQSPARVSGYSGFGEYAQDFDGTDDHIYISDDSSLDITTDISMSMWIKADFTDDFRDIFAKTDGTDWEWECYTDMGGAGNLGFWTDVDGEGNSPNGSFDDTDWHYVTFARAGSTLRITLDGVNIETDAGYGNTSIDLSTAPIYIGRGLDGDDWDGLIQEVRLFAGGHSDNRAATEYKNIVNQSTFWTFSTEESAPGPAVLVNGITPGKVNSRNFSDLVKINSVG